MSLTLVIGELSDAHDILSMKMFELEGATTKQTDEERRNAQPKSEYFESPRDHVDDPKPSSMSGNIFEKDIAPMNKLENSFKYAYFTINIFCILQVSKHSFFCCWEYWLALPAL